MVPTKASTFKRLKDIFYETRVLMGRGYTLHRFATEILDEAVDPVMLSYIEKGKRFATESLVHKLARVRDQDPQELLVLLWQDRMIHAFSRELRRVIKSEKKEKTEGLSDADVAFLISHAIAALPDDGSFITVKRWRNDMQAALKDFVQQRPGIIKTVIDILQEQGLIEKQKEKVRRLERHYVAGNPDEKRSLAVEFCGIFAKGLLEKIVRQDPETYVRNHYLNIPQDRIEDFYQRLDREVRAAVGEYATEDRADKKFLNILITSTPF